LITAATAQSSGQARCFATTRWSLIVAGAVAGEGAGDETKAALSELCRIYWRPIFAYICRRGYSPDDAQDLTQDFFVMVLETNWLQHADPNRGRFRNLLLRSLQNFVGHAAEKKRAAKRGGNVQLVSWDEWTAEAPSRLTVSSEALETASPEAVFDLRWAATIVERALQRLREECGAKGKVRLFDILQPHLAADRPDVSYTKLAAMLGVAETAVKKQLHNLRRRYRYLVYDEVAQTVAEPSEVEEEVRYLCAALASAG
jgi:DNA-directed RNA polymerase specialized sigma24 family protein